MFAILLVLAIVVSFVIHVQSFLLRIGIPEGFVADISGMLLFGLLLGPVILGLYAAALLSE